MAEPFKNLFDEHVVRTIGHHLARVDPHFARRSFETAASRGLQALKLKPRVMQIARALQANLPRDADAALGLMEASLAPVADAGRIVEQHTSASGLAGWPVWPLTEAVALLAIDLPERALAALHTMTRRFTAEFAIRPFIARHPAVCHEALARWVHDPCPQVRRLVSEGSRPRLPWGLRLQALVADPSPALPWLAILQDDPCEDVRRSVANHLNDIAKDHPQLVVDWLRRHLCGASPERRAVLRHASRTLIKQGHPAVLDAWGMGTQFHGSAHWSLTPKRLIVGDELRLCLRLRSASTHAQHLAIDYALHRVKADGKLSAKVFKGWLIDLAPGEDRLLERRHSLRPVTTRRYHPGRHLVELRINGQAWGQAGFELRMPRGWTESRRPWVQP